MTDIVVYPGATKIVLFIYDITVNIAKAGRSRDQFPLRSLVFFQMTYLSSRTMALASTQPLTEMSTRNLPGGKRRSKRKADNLTAICEPIFEKMWEPRRLTTLWASTACYRDSFTFRVNI
jgi:hypothetical protein